MDWIKQHALLIVINAVIAFSGLAGIYSSVVSNQATANVKIERLEASRAEMRQERVEQNAWFIGRLDRIDDKLDRLLESRK